VNPHINKFLSYNMSYLPANINNAGKITVVTAVIGLFVFATFFLFNFGAQELQRATAADIATTTLRVLNTPPAWTASTTEETASATSTPTNSGDEVAWIGTGTDPSAQPYFLLICDSPMSLSLLRPLFSTDLVLRHPAAHQVLHSGQCQPLR
jgi:hypothetical protein